MMYAYTNIESVLYDPVQPSTMLTHNCTTYVNVTYSNIEIYIVASVLIRSAA